MTNLDKRILKLEAILDPIPIPHIVVLFVADAKEVVSARYWNGMVLKRERDENRRSFCNALTGRA